jgi:hypothetical protein
MWENELKKLNSKSLVGSPPITGLPSGGKLTDKVSDLAIKNADIQATIYDLLSVIKVQEKKIIEYIKTIDDSLVRQIIYLRCISLKRWEEIAAEIGGNNTAENVRQMYKRFFEKQ